MVASGITFEFALQDRGGGEWFDLGTTWPGTTRLEVTDNVLALGRGNTTRLGEAIGAERGIKPELGERGGDGNGTEGGGPLDTFVALDAKSFAFTLECFGKTGGSLKLDPGYVESLALDLSVSLPEMLLVR